MSKKKNKRKIIKGKKIQEKLASVDITALPALPEPVPELIEAIKEGYVEEIVLAIPERSTPKPDWFDRLLKWAGIAG